MTNRLIDNDCSCPAALQCCSRPDCPRSLSDEELDAFEIRFEELRQEWAESEDTELPSDWEAEQDQKAREHKSGLS